MPLSAERAVIGLWRFRVSTELAAAGRYRHIADLLQRAGAPLPFVSGARAAADDELAHARLCAELAGEPSPTFATPGEPRRPSGSPARAALVELVDPCCLAETLNVALIVETLEHCREPLYERALRRVLRDEVRHAQLGWAYLAHSARAHDVSSLSAELAPLVERATAVENAADTGPELLPFGCLTPALHREVCARTVAEVIVPGLAANNVGFRAAPLKLEAIG